MKTTSSLLLGSSLLAMAAVAVAGEPVQLDKNFSFRLDQSASAAPSASPLPLLPPRFDSEPRKTPEGEPLPPGTRAFQFNGRTYYRIPLKG